MKPYAVVLGMYGANALGVVRALGKEGIPVAGFHTGTRYAHAAFSRYTSQMHRTEGIGGLAASLLDFGAGHLADTGKKAVVFTTGDNYVLFCEKFAKELGDFYHLPLSKKHSLNDLMDKNKILGIARESGFAVPYSIALSELNSENAESFGENKIICKPANSIGYCKQDFRIEPDIHLVLDEKEGYLKQCGEMSVSEFIPGETTDQREAHTFMTDAPRIAVMLKKIHHYGNPDISIGSVVESAWFGEIVEPSLAFTRAVQFTGPIDINMKRSSANGKYYFLEANFRSSAINSLTTAAGLNIPAILYHHLLGMPHGHLLEDKVVPNIRWVCENKFNSGGFMPMEEIEKVQAWGFHDPEDPGPLDKMIVDGEFDFAFHRDRKAV